MVSKPSKFELLAEAPTSQRQVQVRDVHVGCDFDIEPKGPQIMTF